MDGWMDGGWTDGRWMMVDDGRTERLLLCCAVRCCWLLAAASRSQTAGLDWAQAKQSKAKQSRAMGVGTDLLSQQLSASRSLAVPLPLCAATGPGTPKLTGLVITCSIWPSTARCVWCLFARVLACLLCCLPRCLLACSIARSLAV